MFFLLTNFSLFAGGEAEKAAPANGNWTLCITKFDVSALPETRNIVGQLVAQNLVLNLNTANTRLRLNEEDQYYRNSSALKAQKEAAKKLADKRAERDKLLFSGDAEWMYKSDLKKIEKEIITRSRRKYADHFITHSWCCIIEIIIPVAH